MVRGVTFPTRACGVSVNHNALCQLANQSRLCLSEGGDFVGKLKRLRDGLA